MFVHLLLGESNRKDREFLFVLADDENVVLIFKLFNLNQSVIRNSMSFRFNTDVVRVKNSDLHDFWLDVERPLLTTRNTHIHKLHVDYRFLQLNFPR